MSASSHFRAACKEGDIQAIKTILERPEFSAQPQAKRDEELQRGLFQATANGHPHIVGLLLSRGARIDKASFLILTNKGHIPVLEEFLKHGFNINSAEFGTPFLRLSVGNISLAEWLLQHGADPNVEDERGVTPLETAVIMPISAAPKLLLSHGARMRPDILHRAMRPSAAGGIDMVRFLVEAGADINFATLNHGTPLHYAAYLGLEDVAKLLVDAGANPTSVVNGSTPADLAKMHGERDVYDMLMTWSEPS